MIHEIAASAYGFWSPKPPAPYRKPKFVWTKTAPWDKRITEAYLMQVRGRPLMRAFVARLRDGAWVAAVYDPSPVPVLNQGRCLAKEPRFYGPFTEAQADCLHRNFRRRVDAKRTVQVFFSQRIEASRQNPWSDALMFMSSMALGIFGLYHKIE